MYIDILLGVITLIFVFFSMRKGFFMEVFQLLSLFLSFWLSKNYYYIVSNSILKSISNNTLRIFLSYVIAFVAVFIVSLIIFSKIRDMVSNSKNINRIDKSMGILFGILKSLVVYEIIMLVLLKFEIFTGTEITNNSYVGKLLMYVSKGLNIV